MHQHMHPPIFYKYVTQNVSRIVLDTSKLRWSSPLLFNDPAEFQRMPVFDPTISEAYKEFPSRLLGVVRSRESIDESKLSPAAIALLFGIRHLVQGGIEDHHILESLKLEVPNADSQLENALRSNFHGWDLTKARVLCVTIDHSNDVLWANYAEGHTGCVLGFRHVPVKSTPLLAAVKVSYAAQNPVVGSGIDFLLYGDNPELRSRTTHAVCFTKKAAWSYEQEWRAITWRWDEDSQYGDYLFAKEELESITIGSKASQSSLADILKVVEQRYPYCNVYQLTTKYGENNRVLVRSAARDA